MNRAEIKETAKSYMRQNNNHGGMVGVEILYNLLFDAATAAFAIAILSSLEVIMREDLRTAIVNLLS